MRWLFLIFLFDTSQPQFRPKLWMHGAFNSQAECDKLGKDWAKEFTYKDKALKSFSICIPESFYDEKGLKTETVD